MKFKNMKRVHKLRIFIMVLVLAALLCTGCKKEATDKTQADIKISEAINETGNTSSQVVVNTEFTAKDLEVGYEESTAVTITMNGDSVEITGNGAKEKDGVITISKEGTYVISGNLDNGQILVDAGDNDKIHMILAGMSVTNKNSAPLYIKNADKVFLTLKDGTKNTFTDGTEYVQDDENNVDGAIFSKADLTINGSGTLTVTGNYKHGILSKDDLVITGGNINVTAVKDALNGKDCVKIKDGTLLLCTSTGNGIQSKNNEDATKGFVYIAGGKITVKDCKEGIEGTVIRIDDGEINITAKDDGLNSASGSSTTADAGNTNQDGMQKPTDLPDNVDMDFLPEPQSAPDGANQDTKDMPDGMISGTPANDQNKKPDNFTKDDADTANTTDTADTAADNTSSGRPNGGGNPGGFGGAGMFEPDDDCYILINGGNVYINAYGDGFDSNGNLYISGGNVYISGPTSNGNGAIDYNGTAEITGGTVIAAGSVGMAQGFSETSTQYSFLYNLSSVIAGGTKIKLEDESGNVIASFTPEKEYQSVVISCPDLKKDKTYTLICGDQANEITIDSITTSKGNQGMGWPGGRGGQTAPKRNQNGSQDSDKNPDEKSDSDMSSDTNDGSVNTANDNQANDTTTSQP